MASLLSSAGFKSKEELKASIEKILSERRLPNETLIDVVSAQERASNWYALIINPVLLSKFYLIGLTNQRLLITNVGMVNDPQTTAFYEFKDVKVLKVSKGILFTTLALQFPDGSVKKLTFTKVKGGDKLVQNITDAIGVH